jgi:ring-1,2-phenylacetyl-CoA epoxidase subunit PaaD
MNADPMLATVWAALETVKDPCLVAAGFALSVVDLGLIRCLAIEEGQIRVEITFTEPGCPFTHRVVTAIETALEIAGFTSVCVRPIWDPIWTEEALSPLAKEQFSVARSCMRNSLGRPEMDRQA